MQRSWSAGIQESAEKVEKVSLNWAKLIARIYEADPLTCTTCGKKITILAFVTHREEIQRILYGTIWLIDPPEFDPPYDLQNRDICQLLSDTADGFAGEEWRVQIDAGADPPQESGYDPPRWENIDPPHQEDFGDPPHWEQ